MSALFSTSICGCLGECALEQFARWLNHPEVDLLEWRIDGFLRSHEPGEIKGFCQALRAGPRLPLIATNRPVRQMGAFEGSERLRLGMLEDAARGGAQWVDLEFDLDRREVARFQDAGAKVLMSWHDPDGTPSAGELCARLEQMSKSGADALKIATFARAAEDNLRVLDLIPFARKQLGAELVAFCMGPVGKWSRVASLFMGSPWSYAQLEGQLATAPGQFSAAELRALIRALK